MIHKLKITPRFFKMHIDMKKDWEYRYDDRGYAVGDVIELHEYDDGAYTGRWLELRITAILRHEDFEPIKEGYAILSTTRGLFSQRHLTPETGAEEPRRG